MIKTTIEGSINGLSTKAKVSKYGQLITAPLDFSKFYAATASVANTPVELIPPLVNKRFIITSINLYGNRSVGVNDATVRIYEADGSAEAYDSSTDITIYITEVAKNQNQIVPALNIIVTKGKWINIVASDVSVFANVSGYYIDA